MPKTGLGAPTFLAYSSPTGIAIVEPGKNLDGAQLRENWLLAGFAGAQGWTEWDSPWAAFLQHRPRRVRLDTNGVRLEFHGEAGFLALMPLYGYYKPPQKGREYLSRHGLKDKDLRSWSWPAGLHRDPLTRLRYWAGATRRFPLDAQETVLVDRGRDAVTLHEHFTWLEIPDDWGTHPVRVAPVSPTLGLALMKDQSFPVEFSRPPFDYEIPTPYGPFFGVQDVDAYDMTFHVLQYVNETEAPVSPLPTNAPPVVREALDRLQNVARAKFPSPDRYEHDHGGMKNFCWAILGDQWYARAIPYYDERTRRNALESLRHYVRDEVLVPERYRQREFPEGSGHTYLVLEGPGIGSFGALGDAGKIAADVLETIWAYAHYTGDHAVVRERWPLIRKLFTTAAQTRWVGFGRDEIAELGDEAPPAIAFARLAYLAGDLDAYRYACGIVARELTVAYVKQRGAEWFRRQQPWHSMESMDEDVRLTNLWGDLAGWQIDGPHFPRVTGERQYANRWVRFQDLDLARFYRDNLHDDIAREMRQVLDRWPAERRHRDDSHILPSLVRLNGFLLDASPGELATLGTPEQFTGPPSGIIASCIALIRSVQPPRFVRLIPGAPPAEPVLGLNRDVPGPNPFLVQHVVAGTRTSPEWPRITWWGWKTPTGAPWNFGAVRTGDQPVPQGVATEPLGWNTVEIRAE